MPRVKRGVTARQKHKKVLKFVEGHRGTRRRLIKKARESMMHALSYAYRDRRNRKRDMRRLWITRINAAARMFGVTYSQLMHAIRVANISVDRKILAEMAVNDRPAFAELVKTALAAAQSQDQPQTQA
ncbi:50S ribosomal protein L20 [Thermogemmatispora onikobensis]|uniref:50S ribosomal protein L20 n=1 Tax=Thermogemmatispora onikobensis TaxID=732234 RepID=UPI00085379C9|nr:50S ribosomal protein L20 [Thermogemmatispora onikobensis]